MASQQPPLTLMSAQAMIVEIVGNKPVHVTQAASPANLDSFLPVVPQTGQQITTITPESDVRNAPARVDMLSDRLIYPDAGVSTAFPSVKQSQPENASRQQEVKEANQLALEKSSLDLDLSSLLQDIRSLADTVRHDLPVSMAGTSPIKDLLSPVAPGVGGGAAWVSQASDVLSPPRRAAPPPPSATADIQSNAAADDLPASPTRGEAASSAVTAYLNARDRQPPPSVATVPGPAVPATGAPPIRQGRLELTKQDAASASASSPAATPVSAPLPGRAGRASLGRPDITSREADIMSLLLSRHNIPLPADYNTPELYHTAFSPADAAASIRARVLTTLGEPEGAPPKFVLLDDHSRMTQPSTLHDLSSQLETHQHVVGSITHAKAVSQEPSKSSVADAKDKFGALQSHLLVPDISLPPVPPKTAAPGNGKAGPITSAAKTAPTASKQASVIDAPHAAVDATRTASVEQAPAVLLIQQMLQNLDQISKSRKQQKGAKAPTNAVPALPRTAAQRSPSAKARPPPVKTTLNTGTNAYGMSPGFGHASELLSLPPKRRIGPATAAPVNRAMAAIPAKVPSHVVKPAAKRTASKSPMKPRPVVKTGTPSKSRLPLASPAHSDGTDYGDDAHQISLEELDDYLRSIQTPLDGISPPIKRHPSRYLMQSMEAQGFTTTGDAPEQRAKLDVTLQPSSPRLREGAGAMLPSPPPPPPVRANHPVDRHTLRSTNLMGAQLLIDELKARQRSEAAMKAPSPVSPAKTPAGPYPVAKPKKLTSPGVPSPDAAPASRSVSPKRPIRQYSSLQVLRDKQMAAGTPPAMQQGESTSPASPAFGMLQKIASPYSTSKSFLVDAAALYPSVPVRGSVVITARDAVTQPVQQPVVQNGPRNVLSGHPAVSSTLSPRTSHITKMQDYVSAADKVREIAEPFAANDVKNAKLLGLSPVEYAFMSPADRLRASLHAPRDVERTLLRDDPAAAFEMFAPAAVKNAGKDPKADAAWRQQQALTLEAV